MDNKEVKKLDTLMPAILAVIKLTEERRKLIERLKRDYGIVV